MVKKILFTSKYCGACSEIKKILKKNKVKYKEISVDTEKGGKLADKNSIKLLPTMMIDGKKVPINKWLK